MSNSRSCSRNGCPHPAVATLTYVYADSTAVLGPLSVYAEPHSYDLCPAHSERLTVPKGWEVVRISPPDRPAPAEDDLLALADAVREAARPEPIAQRPARTPMAPPVPGPGPAPVRRGHLRSVAAPAPEDGPPSIP